MVRKACLWEELAVEKSMLRNSGGSHGSSPTFAFGDLLDSARPISTAPAAQQGSHLHPRGSCYLGPAPGYRRDPGNPA